MAEPAAAAPASLWCWRHPRAIGTEGRCVGQTDVPVAARRAKRLAHRIRATARAHGLPQAVWVSTLARSHDVGRWLARWGWRVHVDARLCELNFGAWDGRAWDDIAWAEVEAWQHDLLHHRPGGGESLNMLRDRVRAFVAEAQAAGGPRLLVTHGGWINALLHAPAQRTEVLAAQWPTAPGHGSLSRWP